MEIRDFTLEGIGTVTRGDRTVEECPKCQQNGEKRVATLGATQYLHRAKVIDGPVVSYEPIIWCRVEAN